MGLDNGFVLRRKSDPNFSLELAYFRKYQELDDWVCPRCERTEDGNEYHNENPGYTGGRFIVPVTLINDLKVYISPIVDELMKIHQKISYYDENTYPKKFFENFYSNMFNPAMSNSTFAGWKLMRLYMALEVIDEIMDSIKLDEKLNRKEKDDYYLTFYSSY